MHFQDAQSGRERWAHSASDPSHLANGGDKIKAKAIVWMFANVPQTQHPTASYNSASQMQKAINKIWHITHQTVVQWRRMDKTRFALRVRWMSLALLRTCWKHPANHQNQTRLLFAVPGLRSEFSHTRRIWTENAKISLQWTLVNLDVSKFKVKKFAIRPATKTSQSWPFSAQSASMLHTNLCQTKQCIIICAICGFTMSISKKGTKLCLDQGGKTFQIIKLHFHQALHCFALITNHHILQNLHRPKQI